MAKTKGRSRESARQSTRKLSREKTGRMRLGVTTSEALISALILGIVVSMLSGFALTTRKGLRDRELSARIDWEMVNLRERIGTWETARITEAAIEAVSVPKTLSQRFEESKFTAQISQVEAPIRAKQVTLRFECEYLGQQIHPADLTFWVQDDVAPKESSIGQAPGNSGDQVEAKSVDSETDGNASGGADG